MIVRNTSSRRGSVCLLLMGQMLVWGLHASAGASDWKASARENIRLREYFLPVCFQPGMAGETVRHLNRRIDIPPTGPTNPVFVQECVDRQIERFVESAQVRLNQLRETASRLESFPSKCALRDGGVTSNTDLRQEITTLSKLAEGLYRDLQRAFRFSRKNAFDFSIDPDSKDSCYRVEIAYLSGQIRLGEREIERFFSGSPTVDVDHLPDGFLSPLYEAREVSRALREAMQ